MFFALSLVFLVLSLVTGAHAYVLKNTLSHWLVSMLSVVASMSCAWTAIFFASRSFVDPQRIVLDASFLKLTASFQNHAPTEPLVFGGLWLIACAAPLVVGCLLVRELRKLPELSVQPSSPSLAG